MLWVKDRDQGQGSSVQVAGKGNARRGWIARDARLDDGRMFRECGGPCSGRCHVHAPVSLGVIGQVRGQAADPVARVRTQKLMKSLMRRLPQVEVVPIE